MITILKRIVNFCTQNPSCCCEMMLEHAKLVSALVMHKGGQLHVPGKQSRQCTRPLAETAITHAYKPAANNLDLSLVHRRLDSQLPNPSRRNNDWPAAPRQPFGPWRLQTAPTSHVRQWEQRQGIQSPNRERPRLCAVSSHPLQNL